MKCKECKFYEKGQCEHSSNTVTGVYREDNDNCNLFLIGKGGSRRGFEAKASYS